MLGYKGEAVGRGASGEDRGGVCEVLFSKAVLPEILREGDVQRSETVLPDGTFGIRQITSRVLSLLNTMVVFFIRIPQIMKIIKSRSVYGLSYFGNNL